MAEQPRDIAGYLTEINMGVAMLTALVLHLLEKSGSLDHETTAEPHTQDAVGVVFSGRRGVMRIVGISGRTDTQALEQLLIPCAPFGDVGLDLHDGRSDYGCYLTGQVGNGRQVD